MELASPIVFSAKNILVNFSLSTHVSAGSLIQSVKFLSFFHGASVHLGQRNYTLDQNHKKENIYTPDSNVSTCAKIFLSYYVKIRLNN